MSDTQLISAFRNAYKPKILRSKGALKNKSVQIIHPLKGSSKSYFNTIEISLKNESSEDSASMDSDETQKAKTG